MRWSFLIFLFLLISCAHHDGPDRTPSSEEEFLEYGDHDPQKSSVKEFPPQYEEPIMRHFYFVELKNSAGKFIDRDDHEFEVRMKKKVLPVKIRRSLRGRYYVILESSKDLSTGQLDFFVDGAKLKENFKLGLQAADKAHTKLRKLKDYKSSVKFELVLKDKKGRFVETPDEPEIIPDGIDINVTKLEHMGNGKWHITLTYPQGNQLFYISVRSHGVYFKNLFRFHHVGN
ncbi:MAG: hypothetical protein ACJ76H_07790 [Bacteriovoracaceae bacterium]